MSQASFYKWRRKYGGMYAEEKFKSEIAREAIEKKWLRRLDAKKWRSRSEISFPRAYRLVYGVFSLNEACYRYQAKLSSENAQIADWLLQLLTANKRWGFGLCFLYLRNIKGYDWNRKRVYRVYRENVNDNYNRECLTINADLPLPSNRVICALEQVIEWRGKPVAVRCDNSPEYVSQQLID